MLSPKSLAGSVVGSALSAEAFDNAGCESSCFAHTVCHLQYTPSGIACIQWLLGHGTLRELPRGDFGVKSSVKVGASSMPCCLAVQLPVPLD